MNLSNYFNTNVDNEKLLKARGFMREGKLTVAGLLLFSNNINVYLPGARNSIYEV